MGFLSNIFGGGKTATQKTTADRPFRIPNPSIGFLNLQGEPGAALAAADERILSPLFKSSQSSTNVVPKCEVLFIYCRVDDQGKIVGRPESIRDLIKQAGAYVAVVASENNPNSYIKALGPRKDWSANIVLVIDRKADKLALFFRRLFEAMFSGRSMLMAWVELAPQIPGQDHPDTPASIMAAEAGHVVFRG